MNISECEDLYKEQGYTIFELKLDGVYYYLGISEEEGIKFEVPMGGVYVADDLVKSEDWKILY